MDSKKQRVAHVLSRDLSKDILPTFLKVVEFCVQFANALITEENIDDYIDAAQKISDDVIFELANTLQLAISQNKLGENIADLQTLIENLFTEVFQKLLNQDLETSEELQSDETLFPIMEQKTIFPNADQILDLHFTTGDIGTHLGLFYKSIQELYYGIPGALDSAYTHAMHVVSSLASWQAMVNKAVYAANQRTIMPTRI